MVPATVQDMFISSAKKCKRVSIPKKRPICFLRQLLAIAIPFFFLTTTKQRHPGIIFHVPPLTSKFARYRAHNPILVRIKSERF